MRSMLYWQQPDIQPAVVDAAAEQDTQVNMTKKLDISSATQQ